MRVKDPTINKDGGRHNLPLVLGQHHKEESEEKVRGWERGGGWGEGGSSSLTTSTVPSTASDGWRQQLRKPAVTDEALKNVILVFGR